MGSRRIYTNRSSFEAFYTSIIVGSSYLAALCDAGH